MDRALPGMQGHILDSKDFLAPIITPAEALEAFAPGAPPAHAHSAGFAAVLAAAAAAGPPDADPDSDGEAPPSLALSTRPGSALSNGAAPCARGSSFWRSRPCQILPSLRAYGVDVDVIAIGSDIQELAILCKAQPAARAWKCVRARVLHVALMPLHLGCCGRGGRGAAGAGGQRGGLPGAAAHLARPGGAPHGRGCAARQSGGARAQWARGWLCR